MAFLRRGHGLNHLKAFDPYFEHVALCGLRSIIATYNEVDGMAFDDTATPGNDGKRIFFEDARLTNSNENVTGGAAMRVSPDGTTGFIW